MKRLTCLLFSIVAFTAVSCGSTTSITASYREPEITSADFKKVFIVAMTDNTYVQQAVENSMEKMIKERGASVIKSMDVLPPNFRKVAEKKDKEMVLQKLREKGCDAIMTIALVDAKEETRYVQDSSPYYPIAIPYYGGFGSYYMYGYDSFYSPGYYTDDKIYYLETNVFDANSEKLVWSGQSQTVNPESIEDFLKGYSQAVSERMTKDGLMKKTK
ncbi:DUF4136 domain-containing protein [Flavobacterium hauense]